MPEHEFFSTGQKVILAIAVVGILFLLGVDHENKERKKRKAEEAKEAVELKDLSPEGKLLHKLVKQNEEEKNKPNFIGALLIIIGIAYCIFTYL